MKRTPQTLAVLRMFAARHPFALYGREIMADCSLKSGTLYPILHRLEEAGWVRSDWNTAGYGMPRRYYRLTRRGVTQASKVGTEWNR